MFERVEKNNNVDRALINRERVEIVAVFFYWMLKRNVG